jgi:hypothetical protein
MTKKDYELIAEAIKDVGLFYGDVELDPHGGPIEEYHAPETVLRSVAMELARELAATNPRFDKQRFMAACEVAA